MISQSLLVTLLFSTSILGSSVIVVEATPATVPSWPSASSLVGFWPFTRKYNLTDIGPNLLEASTAAGAAAADCCCDAPDHYYEDGPFGDAMSSIRPHEKCERDNKPLLSIRQQLNNNQSHPHAFTIALFFRLTQGAISGGLFELIIGDDGKKGFQFRYDTWTWLEVAANDQVIGRFNIIQQQNAWTFVAFTFNNDDTNNKKAHFAVYSQHGLIFASSSSSTESNTEDDGTAADIINEAMTKMTRAHSQPFSFNVGYASRWRRAMSHRDVAIACLFVYSVALTAPEIRQAYDACRVEQASTPAGAPKIPASFPVSAAIISQAKAGQFPWLASLQIDGRHRCSAVIVDAYWLLTAASCVNSLTLQSSCQILLGITTQVDSNNKSCQKYIIHPAGKIALVQVGEPIDFTNIYVNDANIVFDDDDNAELKQVVISHRRTAMQFVASWTSSSILGPSSISTVPGYILSDKQCKAAWSGDGDYVAAENLCFLAVSGDKSRPCSGDEGTPIVVVVDHHRFLQVGIFYKRDALCQAHKPGLFLKLAPYAKWIRQQLACSVAGVAYPPNCPEVQIMS